jgi:uncharacterized protein (TIGR04255 family)
MGVLRKGADMNHTHHTYKRNFIKSVIFRLDFPIPILSLAEGKPPAGFQRAVLKSFPLREEKKTVLQQVELTPDSVTSHRTEAKQYGFFDPDRATQIGLAPTFLWVEQTVYKGFERFEALTGTALDGLFGTWPDTAINRLGLRYINAIDEPREASAIDWSDFIQPQLLAALSVLPGSENLARFLVQAEMRGDDHRLRLVTGMPNSDFPGLVRQRNFLIDIDVYIQEALEQDEIKETLQRFHDIVIQYFEKAITQKFRDYLDRD